MQNSRSLKETFNSPEQGEALWESSVLPKNRSQRPQQALEDGHLKMAFVFLHYTKKTKKQNKKQMLIYWFYLRVGALSLLTSYSSRTNITKRQGNLKQNPPLNFITSYKRCDSQTVDKNIVSSLRPSEQFCCYIQFWFQLSCCIYKVLEMK